MNLAELAETFKTARLEQGLSQQMVADLTGISVATISNFERGTASEIGVLKLLMLFKAVKLELMARPFGHSRTLDDIAADRTISRGGFGQTGQRVRAKKKVPDER